MENKFIVTNFSYGTGPFLRTTELALAFNDELARRGMKKFGIIVPCAYREKQRKIMREEFSDRKEEIFLSDKLGKLLRGVFYGNYGNSTYEKALSHWSGSVENSSREANKYLSGNFPAYKLDGEETEIDGSKIALEINRSPRLRYDVAPAYFTSFAYMGQILESIFDAPREKINVSSFALRDGIRAANWVEENQKMHAKAYPATFSWKDDYKPRFSGEVMAPPISKVYKPNFEKLEKGIFVTITGILGLERLYRDADRLGLKIYSNDRAIPHSIHALPEVIPNENIILQFARSGWSSVWLSMISGTPLVVPDYDPHDDPEIYFNNLAIEKMGIGIVYRGQSLEEIIAEIPRVKENSKKMCDKILAKWGTLDGNKYCAQLFAKDFLQLSQL